MRFLFLIKYTDILGGVETLAARMSAWLCSTGHEVTIITNQFHDSCCQLFDSRVRLVSHGRGTYALGDLPTAKEICGVFRIQRPDLIKGFDPETCFEAGVVSRCFAPQPKVVAGVYLPTHDRPSRALYKDTRRRLIHSYFVHGLSRENRIFLGHEQKAEYRGGTSPLMDGHVWPLPVDVGRYKSVKRSPRSGALVSVGRLSPMKEYNFYMVDIVEKLSREGRDVTWDIYGDGPDEQSLLQLVRERNLGHQIKLHGRLPYHKFEDAMKMAYAFIGMGTAAVEAAASGVPVIVAMGHDRSGKTYGRISTLPLGNIGDRMATPPARSVIDEIRALLELSPQAYASEARKDKDYVQQYDVNVRMKQFMEIVEQATPSPPSNYLLFLYSCHLRLEQFFRSTFRRSRVTSSLGGDRQTVR